MLSGVATGVRAEIFSSWRGDGDTYSSTDVVEESSEPGGKDTDADGDEIEGAS